LNAKQARELLVALAACDPGGSFSGVQDAIGAISTAAPGLEWEVSVRGGDSPAVRSRARDERGERPGKAFSSGAFAEPVASALKAFDGLAPISEVRFAAKGRWTLILARPLAWPLFLRCDLSAAYASRAAQLSLVLRDARVDALEFDGEALWARCAG
jgi:hypothetical protein